MKTTTQKQTITIDEFCGSPQGTFARMIRGSSILWKISHEISIASFRGKSERVETLNRRRARLENAGFVKIF